MKHIFRTLRKPTQKWIKKILDRYVFEEHHQRLLLLLGQSWDRAQEAEETLKTEGVYIHDRFQQRKAHPAVGVQRDAMVTFARLLRELALDLDPPSEDTPRPPAHYK